MANWVRDFLSTHPEYNTLTVAKRAKHSIHFQRDEYVEANFTGIPMHYLDAQQGWLPLDTALLLDTARHEYGAPGLATRLKLDGSVRIINPSIISSTLYSQQSTRVGILNIATRKFTAIKMLPAGQVSDDCVIRDGGAYRHILQSTETGLRETLTLLQAPSSGSVDEWFVLETAVSGVSYPDGWLNDAYIHAGHNFPLPIAADAQGQVAPIRRYARTVGGVQYLYTGIPLSWLATAAYPVVIDPDFADDTADGRIYGFDATYATAHSTSYGFSATATTAPIGQSTSYTVSRAFLKFVTSAIGAGATVTQVNLTLNATSDTTVTDVDVQIVKQDWSGQDPLSDANRQTAYDNCLSGTSDDHIWRNTSGMSIHVQYASGNLNTDWVNKTGATYYSLRTSSDQAGAQPFQNETVTIGMRENTTATYRPFLTVAYTGGGGGTAALTGTVTTANENDIVAGGKTIILTLTGDTWIAS